MRETFIVQKKPLLDMVKILQLVPARPGILSSEFFRIVKTKFGAQFSIASEIKGEFTIRGQGAWPFDLFYMDRRIFTPFVLAADLIKADTPFVFSANGKSIVISQGKRKATLAGQRGLKGYGFEKGEADKAVISHLALTDDARFLVHCAINCATRDHSTPQLNCVYVRPRGKVVDIFATNKTLLYQARSSDMVRSTVPVPFPLALVDLLEHESLVEVQWRGTYVALIFKHGKIWQSVNAKAKKDFPAKTIARYIQKGHEAPIAFTLKTRKIAEVISRLGQYLGAVRRQDWLLEINGRAGDTHIDLISEVPATVFREKVMVPALQKTFKIFWPLDQLVPVFEFVQLKDKGDMHVRLSHGRSYIQTQTISLVVPGKA